MTDDLIYPTAYHALKSGPCSCYCCKHDGNCEKCDEYGDIRKHAARDCNRISALSNKVEILEKCADEARALIGILKGMVVTDAEGRRVVLGDAEVLLRHIASIEETDGIIRKFDGIHPQTLSERS